MAVYIALLRPPAFKQLISIGIPDSLRDVIEDGQPECVLSMFDAMLGVTEKATRLAASDLLARLGWA